MKLDGIILISAGCAVSLFAHPRIGNPIMRWLTAQELVRSKVPAKEAEIVRGAGPNLSLLFAGAILIILGIVIL